jgi:hypothetical protein
MSETVMVLITVVIFLIGVCTGVMILIATTIRREDRGSPLPRDAPDMRARATRLLMGLARDDFRS